MGRGRGLLRKYNCGEREGTTEEVQLWGERGDYWGSPASSWKTNREEGDSMFVTDT